jgi:hypothetical protein
VAGRSVFPLLALVYDASRDAFVSDDRRLGIGCQVLFSPHGQHPTGRESKEREKVGRDNVDM